ncbi:hypothetical protein E1B28_004650 [Marasmius oreades]|uniref:C2H2-type domain-containing protein n=1 Tax=Marasmius oreades TaxID=181124 RepID=A0A9P7UZ06_9AGAR|nr:uncharacterized protein E1B28_004650 [Marasmius oreades]KAG7097285.1 hypothetical protein E1B28_004650 [Marasmius oreades]
MVASEHVCPVCGKSFSRKGDLTRHRRGIHGGERPYVCRVCYKAFSQASGLKTHKNVHTGAKPFACNVDGCAKAFGDPSSCARHRKEIHREAESYSCPVDGCNSRIKRRSGFACHLRKHGWDTNDLDLDTYASRKRVSRPKPSAELRKTVKPEPVSEPVFFTSMPLPAYHGASHGKFDTTYSTIPYANHAPYHDTHYNQVSVYLNPLPNSLYSAAPSRATTQTPDLGFSCSFSPASNSSLRPTPEPLTTLNPFDFSSFDDLGNPAKMFVAYIDNNLWPLGGIDHTFPGTGWGGAGPDVGRL